MRPALQSAAYPFLQRQLPCYVGGQIVADCATFENVNPVNGKVAATVALADRSLVDRAVQSARAALSGPWGQMSLQERCALLRKAADRIDERFAEFVAAEITDTGKPLGQASQLDIPRGAANFRAFADLVQGRAAECYEMATTDGRGALNYSVHKPAGVVAVIAPWNLPFLLMTWKVAPALACGNTVIAKPSEETPSSATLLAEVVQEVGFPPGVFNLVHGFGAGSTGEFLCAHPDIDAIAFTGESATGSAIMKSASDTLKAVSFELGGKNAAIIFADANFETAVRGTSRSVFANCGQVCLNTERVYVERRIFGPFVEALVASARALKIGGPYDGADTGPLISLKHREKVLSYYRLACEEKGEILIGGGVPHFGDERDAGAFVEPTIVRGMPEHARCVKEEVFGPICHVAPFDSEDEVIGMANDTRFGLAAVVWTSNLQRAHRVARRMQAGIVWVNDWYLRDLRTPFGGAKQSGIGREGGMHSLAFFSEPMNICIKL